MKALFLLFALAAPAFARIGETKEQCIERYGSPVEEFEGDLIFAKGGMDIHVEFHQGKACWISFEKKEGKLSEDEIKTLLNANGPKVKWEKMEHEGDMNYLDTENRLMARFNPAKQVLYIRTTESVKRSAAETKKEELENLKGF